MSSFLQEESQNAERKCTKSVQYKILESHVSDSKDSLGSYKLHLESDRAFGESTSAGQLTDMLGKDPIAQMSGKTDKLASRFYPIENKPSLPEESLIFVGETQKRALAERKEKLCFKGEAQNLPETEFKKAEQAQTVEVPSKAHGSNSSLNKPEEDSGKQEQSPREFFRKGSLRLKQLLNPKGEKKPEEDATPESWKPEKPSAGGLKRLSKGDFQEAIEEEKSPKPAPSPLVPIGSQSPQHRFPHPHPMSSTAATSGMTQRSFLSRFLLTARRTERSWPGSCRAPATQSCPSRPPAWTTELRREAPGSSGRRALAATGGICRGTLRRTGTPS
ncbi:Hypothetical predicted protein [Podarcis lilfordi]|uniref:Uncharacterized protein n=1 Tax=Podarcis lilfordi TaxID=74358 RepID=A0AA35KIE8_9SAUR|nr:Hypothetical predicted protein [Podarcis lilfordi]